MQHPDTLPRGWSVRLAALLAGSAILIGLLMTSSVGTVFAQSVAPASAAPSVVASAAPSVTASAAPSVAASGAVGASSAPIASASAAASGGVLGAAGGGGASAPATSTLPADTGSGQTSLLVPLLLLAGVFVAAALVIAPRATRRR